MMSHNDSSREIWKPVVGYEGYYEVSDFGRVRSVERFVSHWRGGYSRCQGKILAPAKAPRTAHLQVALCRYGRHRTYPVHRLVLAAFVGPCPDGMECCHNNGIADDNRLVNLRWDTPSSNRFDAVRHGTHQGGRPTHCPHGHEYTPDNIYQYRSKKRDCKTCHRVRASRRRAARRAVAA